MPMWIMMLPTTIHGIFPKAKSPHSSATVTSLKLFIHRSLFTTNNVNYMDKKRPIAIVLSSG